MRTLSIISIAIFLLYSCSNNTKAVISPQSSMSATVDDTAKNFGSLDTLRAIGTTGLYFSSGNGSAKTSDRIAIYLGSVNGIKPGTYTTSGENGNSLQLFYEKGGPGTNDYFYDYGSNYPASLTLTSVSSTNVQGTFTGTLILESSLNTTSHKVVQILNGKFNLTGSTAP